VSAAAGDFDDEAPLTVGELLGLVQGNFERDFPHLLVCGELTSVNRAASGHLYFTLSDDGACVECAMWRTDTFRLAWNPRQGEEVVVRGRLGVFARSGRMQLYANAMKPVGAGAAQAALEALRRKLAAEGLFATERKRPLPWLPAVVGVVTSRGGAALHDILVTLKRRFPGVRVVLASTVVQGAEAPRGIVAALSRLESFGLCDVVIVGRGGGASEDLAAFNDEAVVRAVATFPVPVVSAVGHEVDVSLCDLAADHRAATPTAAAEAVVPVRLELAAQLAKSSLHLHEAIQRRLAGLRMHVDARGGRLRHPAARIADIRQRADRCAMLLERALRAGIAAPVRRLAQLASSLDALSPLAVLERGYSLATVGGAIVRDAAEVSVGDRIELRFRRGRAGADVVWRELAAAMPLDAAEPAREQLDGDQTGHPEPEEQER
jgi:exodeoxyribonuclease VII large subunit